MSEPRQNPNFKDIKKGDILVSDFRRNNSDGKLRHFPYKHTSGNDRANGILLEYCFKVGEIE